MNNKPFVGLTLLLLLLSVEFDCLIITDDWSGFSSDFICRGGIGGGRGIEFFFDSLSIQKNQWEYTIRYLPYPKGSSM